MSRAFLSFAIARSLATRALGGFDTTGRGGGLGGLSKIGALAGFGAHRELDELGGLGSRASLGVLGGLNWTGGDGRSGADDELNGLSGFDCAVGFAGFNRNLTLLKRAGEYVIS